MGELDNSILYLSGAIDRAADSGISWRQDFKNLAKNKGLNLTILDPTCKPGGLLSEAKQEQKTISDFKKNKEWKQLSAFVKKFRRQDLRFVDLSDFLVVYIDSDIPMCGTWDEVFTAEDQKKPIFAICKGGKEKLSSWVFGVIEINEMFDSIEECVNKLVEINNGEVELDDRWVLIRNKI